jgi:CubicO group peptidase (beta-lactamase class C family)
VREREGSAGSETRRIAADPGALGVDPERLEALLAQVAEAVRRDGLPSAQAALARCGELVALCTFGNADAAGRRPATNRTLYAAFSTTKALVASAVWILLQEDRLRLDESVADAIPEFAANGKQGVRVEHLLTHTAGFPRAPFDPLEWSDRQRRLARFAGWRLDWEPGSRFEYHPSAGMWVLAELIERRAGVDFRTFFRDRVARPLGLADLHLGLPEALGERVAEVVHVGAPPPAEALEAVGLRIPGDVGDEASIEAINRPELRAVGAPGGGGILNAGDLALFYQALLHDGRASGGPVVWKPEILAAALRVRTGTLVDPMIGKPANRGLGVVIAGDATRVARGFAPSNSPAAFGHWGAGGQVAWADPATGLSFVFFTNGMDRNPLRLGGRGIALSAHAAACASAG